MTAGKVFIVAGEASGDILGGRLISALNKLHPGLTYSGVGGITMTKLGFNSLFPMHELSVMGIMEVLPRYLQLRRRFFQTMQAAIEFQPDIVVTVDFPGFNIRLAKELRKHLPNTKFVQYVGPSVWAHKPERAKVVADLFDHVLLLLPFEKSYFDRVGVANTVVGHPILEHECRKVTQGFASKYLTDPAAIPILVMPGSRESEIKRLLPIFAQSLKMLGGNHIYLMPTMGHLEDIINQYGQGLKFRIITDDEERWQAMAASKIALAKSGTTTVELMRYGVPMVIAYHVNWLSELYIRRYVTVKYASLANLLLDRHALPEFLFSNCTASNIHAAMQALLTKPALQQAQKDAMKEAINLMQDGIESNPGETPSAVAARVIAGLLG
ncbi:MAG: lipid-A-disaccharide synthase [Proteobacteria bacterium]|nr:lipid-A-disaccharide synthase [Pseudomonadota bacterium]